MQDSHPGHRTKERIARAIGESARSWEVRRVTEKFDWNNMKPVLGNEKGELLVFEAYSGDHYLYTPTGRAGEYETRVVVEDIVPGEPIPERFLDSSWNVINRQWRSLVMNDSLETL
jgi:hypothetical protein